VVPLTKELARELFRRIDKLVKKEADESEIRKVLDEVFLQLLTRQKRLEG